MNTSAASYPLILTLYDSCSSSTKGTYVLTAWFVVYLLLLPLFLSVLYIGFTKWRTQCNSAAVSISHCDVFTFHMAVQEMLITFGAALFMFGLYQKHLGAAAFADVLMNFTFGGQRWFHALTCMDRYLAVVHPITYLRSKQRGGVTIRNIITAVVWLLGVIYILPSLVFTEISFSVTLHFVGITIVCAIVIFCSISVLCVLIRPGPGERGGNRKKMDQSKLSAFTTIMVILGVLLLRLLLLVVFSIWAYFSKLEVCFLTAITFWFSLPSNLVLPLLFLNRNGKLSACC